MNYQYRGKVTFWETGKDDTLKPLAHSVMFKNSGDQRVRINKIWVLDPGEETPPISMMIPEVIDETEYRINFDASAGGTQPHCTAIILNLYKTRPNGNDLQCQEF